MQPPGCLPGHFDRPHLQRSVADLLRFSDCGAPPARWVDSPVESVGTDWDVDTIAGRFAASKTPVVDTVVDVKTYVVQARDTLWSIADRTLGDGLRWTEIRDANLGRIMPDGTTITASTETINVGWDLQLPVEAALPLGHEAASDEASEVKVEPGDHFWKLAENAIADAWGRAPTDAELTPYWAQVVDSNTDRLLPPHDPDMIYPGQVVELPTVPADPTAPDHADDEPTAPADPERLGPTTSPTTTSTTPTSTVIETSPSTPLSTSTTSAEHREASSDDSSDHSVSIEAVGLATIGIGAGVLALTLRRRRARQAARRPPGTRIEDPPPSAAVYEDTIRPIADTEAARWIEATNKLLTHRLAQTDADVLPAVVAMRAGQFGVELLLNAPCRPPVGFVPTPEGPTIWRLDADLALDDIEAEVTGAHSYSPALLPVGRTPAGDLLIDFEQLGTLAVSGEADTVTAWQRSVAVAAAVTPWSSDCEVVAIGMPDDVDQLANVTVPDDSVAWVQTCVAEMTRLAERLDRTPYRLRVLQGEIFWPRLVIVGAGNDELARQLADTASLANAPLAVVADAELPGAEQLHFADEGSVLEPFGLTFEPIASNPAEPARVSELLGNADSESSPASDGPEESSPIEGDEIESVEEILQRVMAPRPIEVKILARQPAVQGLEKEIPTKQLSVLCYLAYHREVSSQRLRETFWPTATNRSTADNALSQLRRILGVDDDGEQRLTAATNSGNYELSEDVGCDWTRASRLIAAAEGRVDGQAMALLDTALSLVAGSPGADAAPKAFDWLVEDPSTYRHVETTLVDAACRLAEIGLSAGHPERAERAAQQGLLLVPGHEALYRVRLRVAAGRRDYVEVDRLYQQLCELLSDHSLWDTPGEETETIVRAAAEHRRAGY